MKAEVAIYTYTGQGWWNMQKCKLRHWALRQHVSWTKFQQLKPSFFLMIMPHKRWLQWEEKDVENMTFKKRNPFRGYHWWWWWRSWYEREEEDDDEEESKQK